VFLQRTDGGLVAAAGPTNAPTARCMALKHDERLEHHQEVYRLVSSRSLAATHPFPEILLICCLPRQEQRLRFAWGNSTDGGLAAAAGTETPGSNQSSKFVVFGLLCGV
jgi:hypothetical protein